MSGGMEWCDKQAKKKLQEETEARALDVYYKQQECLKAIGLATVELINLVGKYKEIK